MYLLSKIVIYQLAMLVYWRVLFAHVHKESYRPRWVHDLDKNAGIIIFLKWKEKSTGNDFSRKSP